MFVVLLFCCFVVVKSVGVVKSVVRHSHVFQLAPGAFGQTAVVLALHIVVQHPLWFVHWYLVHDRVAMVRVAQAKDPVGVLVQGFPLGVRKGLAGCVMTVHVRDAVRNVGD